MSVFSKSSPRAKDPAVVLGHGVGKAITEVELRGVVGSFAVARKRKECRLCFLRSYRNEPDSSHFQKFANILFGLLDAGVPLAADAQRRLEERDSER